MGWIASLLAFQCPFCGQAQNNIFQACLACSAELYKAEQQNLITTQLESFKIFSCAHYEGWVQNFILRQKKNPNPTALQWCANILYKRMSKKWHTISIIWVPAKFWRPLHFVEALSLQLHKLGQPIIKKPTLFRTIAIHTKSQKLLNKKERHTQNLSQIYKLRKTTEQQQSVILLDDVITTGNTLLACKQVLELRGNYQVLGAITLAATPKLV